ncbi:hypothetical protein RHO15_09910 [Utexia brackfieldae]|uniref:hypothetical protein n=1 Tax=Utexia brackfieldae TaxID=3074108 RepID=UPI00370DC89E
MKNFDFHFYKSNMFTIILALFLVWAGNTFIPLYNGLSTAIAENLQSLGLLLIAVYSYFYARRYPAQSANRIFWYWSVMWWIMLFGRGISWGRDFFPDVPHLYFRIISIILIGLPVLMLFSKSIRQQIKHRFFFEKIPVWHIILAFVFLGLSDIVEHHRSGANLLLYVSEKQDLIEELIEIPCFISLILIVLYMQRNERNINQSK